MTVSDLLFIENDALRVGVTPRGAELRTLYGKQTALDLLKREDDPSWSGVAPLLFPICGRLTEKTTLIGGTPYNMGTHGFAGSSAFTVAEHTSDRLVLTLASNADTLKEFPFRFTLTAEYRLSGASLETRVTVENTGDTPLPFTVGFHPAFRLPLGACGKSADAYLAFPQRITPSTWRLTESGYLLEGTDPIPLLEGRMLPLTEELFSENSSVFLVNTGNSVRLRSTSSPRSIRLDYDGFPYLGLWRPTDSDAFICIEPWMGCPDYDGRITELSEKRDMTLLPKSESRTFSYTITEE